jgi:hypothetical protein
MQTYLFFWTQYVFQLVLRFQELVSTTLQPDFTPDGVELKVAEKADPESHATGEGQFMPLRNDGKSRRSDGKFMGK